MQSFAVLLRGINVGGHNKVPMKELRGVLAAAGLGQVRTYIQSGNVVLDSDWDRVGVEQEVRAQVQASFGLDIPVVARSQAEMDEVLAGGPFADRGGDPGRQLHVAFMEGNPDSNGVAGLDPHRADPEELAVVGRHIYLWVPDGLGRSKVMSGVERAIGTKVTVRNWRTVEVLRGMMG